MENHNIKKKKGIVEDFRVNFFGNTPSTLPANQILKN